MFSRLQMKALDFLYGTISRLRRNGDIDRQTLKDYVIWKWLLLALRIPALELLLSRRTELAYMRKTNSTENRKTFDANKFPWILGTQPEGKGLGLSTSRSIFLNELVGENSNIFFCCCIGALIDFVHFIYERAIWMWIAISMTALHCEAIWIHSIVILFTCVYVCGTCVAVWGGGDEWIQCVGVLVGGGINICRCEKWC